MRAARTSDVRAIRALVAPQAERRVLLNKEAVAYYESVSDFVVAEIDGAVVGCGALHVLLSKATVKVCWGRVPCTVCTVTT